jgi:hypothetical protein
LTPSGRRIVVDVLMRTSPKLASFIVALTVFSSALSARELK